MKMTRFFFPNFLFMQSFRLTAIPLAALTIFCCARTVTISIPPVVELSNYQNIGLVEFVSQPEDQLGKEATRKFIENLHAAQPGIPIVEIGSQVNVLTKIGYDKLDFRSIRAIGDHFGVKAVITGTVELSEPQPDFKIAADQKVLAAKVTAKVEGRMIAKLWETASGATTWNNSAWGSWTVGGISFDSNGRVSAGYKHLKEKKDQILTALVRALNGDFWPSYEKRKVTK